VKIVKSWRKREFMAKVSGRVADNLYAACVFVADQVRARAPRGETGLLIENVDLDVEVQARDEVIEGRVGVRKKVYYAWFVEMGTSRQAARPFVRPAVFENAREIVRIISGG
jgi:HK97 gp10 family phage protein